MYLPRFVGGLLEDRGTSKLSVHSWVTAGVQVWQETPQWELQRFMGYFLSTRVLLSL